MNDNSRNTIVAVILSRLVLIAWQYFYNVPQMEKQRAAQQAQTELQKQAAPQANNGSTTTQPNAAPKTGSAPAAPVAANAPVVDRKAALEASPRVKIETPNVIG